MPKLHPHQEKAVSELSNGKILWGDVGTGKSLTAAAYYVAKEIPRDVYVITTAKKRDSLDWEKEFSSFAIGKSSEATVGGILKIDSWNNIEKYIGVKDAFFIFDEQRLVGTGKWVKSFYKIARENHWILLTATPGDVWLDYAPVFIANGFYKNITEFKREHVVYNMHAKFPKVDRYISVGRLVKYRNNLLVHMPYERHTNRVIHIEKCTYDEELFKKVWEKRWHVYEERPLRDVAEMFSVARKVVNSDLSRLRTLQDILNSHPKVIVFYNFDYELALLRAYLEPMARKSQAEALLISPSKKMEQSSPTSLKTTTTTSASSGLILDRVAGETPTSASLKGVMENPASENEEVLAEWMKRARQLPKKTSGPSSTLLNQSLGEEIELATGSTCLDKKHNSLRLATGSSLGSLTEEVGPGSTLVRTEKSGTSLQDTPPVSIAEWNGHKHQEIPKTDRWVYLVQYVAGAEGWNCIETDCVVFWSLTYSYKNWHQAHGRIDRLNTPFKDLHYYVLKSDALIDQAVWRSLKGKKSFNEADFGKNMRF